MAAEPQQPPAEQRTPAGDPRESDRRAGDRRQLERRRPPPPWRRPWAFVAYGVVATLVGVLALRAMGDDEPDLPAGEITEAPPPAPAVVPAVRRDSVSEAAYTAADFERLMVEGPAAIGRRVRAELWCEAPDQVALSDVEQVEAQIAPLIDQARRTVPAAECKWGRRDDARREDFLLLIPPALAGQFATAPEASDDFIRRRRLLAEVEWLGRSPALATRTVGVFQGLVPQ
ncbi:MAG TPA: hypothetical protein VFX98_14525 [Longimicrobiaceae bacterium]|nr:hypothetical protein [Longimicrobiaceae bacterium]